MRIVTWLALLSLVGGPATAAPCAPQKLIHIVFREVTPGIDPASFRAQPRSLYRLGDGKMRSEEADDPARHLHQLAVIAEPNFWMVNLSDNTGVHAVDPGPTFSTHAPVFVGAKVSPRITELEFGCEAEFIKANAMRPVRAEQVDGESYQVYRLDGDGDAVEILEKSGKPGFARYLRADELLEAWRYERYELEPSDAASLFAPPAGVKYEER
jgi:hypothetical protein